MAMPNSCPLHPDAMAMERTLNGRLGCLPCLYDPGNLDPLTYDDGVDVDDGESRCPRCRAVVAVQALPNGACIVVEPDGALHRHLAGAVLSPEDRAQIRALFYPPEEVVVTIPARALGVERLRLD